MNKILLFITIFSFGYMTNDIIREGNIKLGNEAHAKVAGMSYYALKSDYDFKKAVKSIISNDYINNAIDWGVLAYNYNFESAVEDIIEDCSVNIYGTIYNNYIDEYADVDC